MHCADECVSRFGLRRRRTTTNAGAPPFHRRYVALSARLGRGAARAIVIIGGIAIVLIHLEAALDCPQFIPSGCRNSTLAPDSLILVGTEGQKFIHAVRGSPYLGIPSVMTLRK